MKVLKSTHKGLDVLLCRGCSAVVENKHTTQYFPEGYHYDVCPKCKEDLDYKEPIEIVPTVFKPSDFDILQRLVKERQEAIKAAKAAAEAAK